MYNFRLKTHIRSNMKDHFYNKSIHYKTNRNLLNFDILQHVVYILDMDCTENYHLSQVNYPWFLDD